VNPLDSAKDAVAGRMMAQVTPSEHPLYQSIADTVVGVENYQARALQELIEAHGLNVEHGHNPERRREIMLSLADAVTNDRVEAWWWETIAPEMMENPEKVRKHSNLSSEEWHDQLRDWYSHYHDKGLVETPIEELDDLGKIGQVADRHVRHAYGMDLRQFVTIVVAWDRGQAVEHVLAGPALRQGDIIRQAAEKARGDS